MKILVLISLFIPTFTFAAGVQIEPVYGVERNLREFPKPARYKTSTFIGMRATYGVPLISAELEVNQSITKEEFPEDDLDVTYTDQKLLLGIRSYPVRSKFFGFYFRAGGRAQKQKREIVEASESRTEEDPVRIDPYAGTGLTLAFADNFALNAGATLVYNRHAEGDEKFDTRYTFGMTIKAGNK